MSNENSNPTGAEENTAVINETPKSKQGRKKGATATAKIIFSKLTALVGNDPDAVIEVGRRWAKQFRLDQLTLQADADIEELLEEVAATPAPVVKIEEKIQFEQS
jgi:predicted secreted Zn-dependent protease